MLKIKINPTLLISFELALIAMSISSMITTLILIPRDQAQHLKWQNQHAKSIAMQFSLAIQTGREKTIQNLIDVLLKQFPELDSIALKVNSKTLISSADHELKWSNKDKHEKALTNITLEIPRTDGAPLELALCYKIDGHNRYHSTSLIAGGYTFAGTFLFYLLFIRKMFKKSFSSANSASTDRVNEIFNTMSEAIAVLDNNEKIILANNEFLELTGKKFRDLKDKPINNLSWSDQPETMPWTSTITGKQVTKGVQLSFTNANKTKIILVNSSPVLDKDNTVSGVMVTLSDVTELHEQNEKIKIAMLELKENHKKIQAQNAALKEMSMKDPLTGCLNRRAFFELFDTEWSSSKRYGYELSCIMMDIDYFKKINDNHGHSKGDEVLKALPQVINDNTRKSDQICRYGGEEFCILMPHTEIDDAVSVAEKIREKIEDRNPGDIHTTVSIGVSATNFEAKNPQELIDQADKALYHSKHNGRNQHTRWDNIPAEFNIENTPDEHSQLPHHDAVHSSSLADIPFQAVNALVTALEQRDALTGMHCRRVADLCVAIARDIMDNVDLYVLEVAALLHDIGKIGVPDSILTKTTDLTSQELTTVNYHLQRGADIMEHAFHSSELTIIIKYIYAWYSGTPGRSDLPTGENIPLRSRIIFAATAYDSITTDSVYREGKSPKEAIEEMKENSPAQFDPWVVSRIEEIITARQEERQYMIPNADEIKALKIGLEIEKLICAAEAEDIALMSMLAATLAKEAANLDIPEVAYPAAVLNENIENGKKLSELITSINEIIYECNKHTGHRFIQAKQTKPDHKPASEASAD